MISMYLKFAARNLFRRKGFAFLNIGGLAIGMTCCLLIGLYVIHQLSYDRHHENGDRLYRVKFQLTQGSNVYREASVPFPTAAALKAEFPEVERAARLYRLDDPPILQVQDRKFAEPRFYFVDPSMLDMMTVTMIRGDKTVFQEPSNVSISQAMADKYFGKAEPLGQVIRMVGVGDFKVAGIHENTPASSHVHFDFIAPLQFQLNLWESWTGQEGREKKWFWTGAWTYVMLRDPTDVASLEAKLPEFVRRYFPERTRNQIELSLQPIRDIHLHSQLDNEIEPTGNFTYVVLFSAIAVAVLLIACINFINLTTAEAVNRARELGVRKIVGAQRGHMIGQILCEALLSSGLAALVTVGSFELSAQIFENLVGSRETLSIWSPGAIVGIIAVTMGVGLVSGLYPAFYLTRVNPLSILNRTERFQFGRGGFRQVLVVAQFTVSITLLIGISVIYRQLDLFDSQSLGFDKDQVVMIKAQNEVDLKWESFRQVLTASSGIAAATRMSNVPGEGAFVYRFVPEGGSIEKPESLPLMLIDYDFTQVLGIGMAGGRTISREFPSDPAEGFLLNETAARQLGWGDQAVGKKLDLFAPGRNEIGKSGRVIGVVKDYHFESLHHAVKPLVFTYAPFGMSHYAIKITGGETRDAIAHLEKTWNEFCPEKPLEFHFLDQRLHALYRSERNASAMVRTFSVIAILVSCLGLYGLSVHTAERRTKEIGIRKTLGATVRQIFVLLSTGFMKPVAVANLLAWPLAYVAASRWLEQFAYHVSLHTGDFIFGTVIGMAITLVTVSYQTWTASTANPVKALKYE